MTQQHVIGDAKKRLPLAGKLGDDLDVEAELSRFESEERARLGLEKEERWVEQMANLGFTKSEKPRITLLIGGLTVAHDFLVQGALKHLGYETIPLDCPDNDALRVGKEFGNRAQCNPTYFTVGNLVKYLIQLRDEQGMSTQEIVDKFVFLTAGACGPCRFGMYVTEYRKALRDAGFDGFRVMLFQQQGGLSQATGEASGLELNPKFFLGLIKALIAGDVINGMGYRIRPYELEPGATDRALSEAKQLCFEALARGGSILRALLRARKVLAAVRVDRTQVKPKVAIIGEFWAMTTEGDGNYQLQRFLESEGAECDIQFVSAWILYNIWEVRFDTANRATLRTEDGGRFGLAGAGEHGVALRELGLWAGDKLLRAAFQSFAWCVGFHGYKLPDMEAIAELAAPYYDNDLRGGEGHMEVGKLILNVVHNKANMTLSVKPFGCMPSSGVSDGVQSLITEKYPGTIFCAVETSGDGAVNFYSRVQMYLFKAKQVAQAELSEALARHAMSLEEVQAFLRANPRLGSALHHAPHAAGCTAADLVNEIAALRGTTRLERLRARLGGVGAAALRLARDGARRAPGAARAAAGFVAVAGTELAEIARDKGPGVADALAERARSRAAEILPFVRASTDAEEAQPIAAE
jgi:predicted nucleotide-binding protein (sugar kinase/HSP70/actin superfamily)